MLTAAGALVGNAIDQRLGSGPWVLLTLTLLGFLTGLFTLIRTLSRLETDDERP